VNGFCQCLFGYFEVKEECIEGFFYNVVAEFYIQDFLICPFIQHHAMKLTIALTPLMAGVRARTSVFAIQVLKVTIVAMFPSASITVVVMGNAPWVTAAFVTLTGQGTDVILRHATTFNDVQVRTLSDECKFAVSIV
jgi:hypothetical protein